MGGAGTTIAYSSDGENWSSGNSLFNTSCQAVAPRRAFSVGVRQPFLTSGAGLPTATIGSKGDIYLDTTTGKLYTYT